MARCCTAIAAQGHVLEHEVLVSTACHDDSPYDPQDKLDHGELVSSLVWRINASTTDGILANDNLFAVSCTYERRSMTPTDYDCLIADPTWVVNHLP